MVNLSGRYNFETKNAIGFFGRMRCLRPISDNVQSDSNSLRSRKYVFSNRYAHNKEFVTHRKYFDILINVLIMIYFKVKSYCQFV